MVERTLAEVEKKIAIRKHYDNFIGGEWVPPARGQSFDNVSPIDGSVVCTVARSTAEDIERALDAAHAAKDAWARTSPADRAQVLNRIADRMEEKLDALA
ncbi:MAG: aldehyde dehydrogenase family protein, partial [Acetobacteraceae bacterium]|nr:aldehyde dehydrogenase family protein [Acetobacteraceae bacterium]